MREIKYRVWDSHCKYFIYFDFSKPHFDDDTDQITFDCDKVMGDHGGAERFTFLQYTGLKDKNGKEIYEGDIVPCIYERDGHTDHVYEVIWHEVSAAFRLRRHGNACSQIQVVKSMSDTTRNTVIGNIYEDSELLP